DQHDKSAVLDRNRNAVQDLKAAKRFPHVADMHRRHPLLSRIRSHRLILPGLTRLFRLSPWIKVVGNGLGGRALRSASRRANIDANIRIKHKNKACALREKP